MAEHTLPEYVTENYLNPFSKCYPYKCSMGVFVCCQISRLFDFISPLYFFKIFFVGTHISIPILQQE